MNNKYWCYVLKSYIGEKMVFHVLPDEKMVPDEMVPDEDGVRNFYGLSDNTVICLSKQGYEYKKWLNENTKKTAVCPYCGCSDHNCEDYYYEEYEDYEFVCPKCNNSFYLKIEKTIKYTTRKSESYKDYAFRKQKEK